jgi:hypothetical protein
MDLKRSSSRSSLNHSIGTQVETAGMLSKSEHERLKIRNIRMADSDWKRLKDHFAARGLSVSAGIRFIVKEYLRQHQYALRMYSFRRCSISGCTQKVLTAHSIQLLNTKFR